MEKSQQKMLVATLENAKCQEDSNKKLGAWVNIIAKSGCMSCLTNIARLTYLIRLLGCTWLLLIGRTIFPNKSFYMVEVKYHPKMKSSIDPCFKKWLPMRSQLSLFI